MALSDADVQKQVSNTFNKFSLFRSAPYSTSSLAFRNPYCDFGCTYVVSSHHLS